MKQEPLISVIVPVYKVPQYLEQCVDSILCQTYENLEILLVDDGSPDHCGAICDGYARKDSRVRVIHKENGGLSSARNAGLDAARGDYVAFADSDDWVEPDAYRAMLELAQKYQVSLVCAGRYDYSEKRETRKPGLCPMREEVLSAEEMLGRLLIWDQCDSAAWDKLYARSLFEGIRYPLGKYYEDIGTTYLVVEKAEKVAMLPVPVYNYRHRSNSITMAPLTAKTFHMEQLTEVVCPNIVKKFPGLKRQAEFLRVRSLRYSVITGELSDPGSREPFRRQLARSRKELRSHTWFLLFSPLFSRTERMQNLALAWGLYGKIHSLRHRES